MGDEEKGTVKTETTPLVALVQEDEVEDVGKAPSIYNDAVDTIKLGVPIFIARLSWVGMKTTDTALLGRVSGGALAAAALSDLWTMCSAVLIQGRVLGVLVGGAVGAGNPKLAGIYLQVSLAVLSVLAVGVFICWNITERIWLAFGSDPDISRMAGYYARILSFSIPAQLIFGQLSQYFSAQRIMHPEVNTSSFALLCNLIFGLVLVLGIPFPNFYGFGFAACPIVTATVEYVQILVLWYVYMHKQRLHIACWDGWAPKEITWDRIKTFSELYFPSAFGAASDFWRVAVIGAVAAKLGEEEVAVFNTGYRIMWIVLVMVMAMAGASGINMTMRLGKLDHKGAKQAAYVGLAMAGVICLVITIAAWTQIRAFGRIFTSDDNFLNLFEEARTPFTITLFLMNMSVAIETIPNSMGRTKEVFWLGLIASWGGQVPGVFLCTKYWRADLIGLYTGMAIGYALLVFLYGYIAFTSDWEKYAKIARLRSEAKGDD